MNLIRDATGSERYRRFENAFKFHNQWQPYALKDLFNMAFGDPIGTEYYDFKLSEDAIPVGDFAIWLAMMALEQHPVSAQNYDAYLRTLRVLDESLRANGEEAILVKPTPGEFEWVRTGPALEALLKISRLRNFVPETLQSYLSEKPPPQTVKPAVNDLLASRQSGDQTKPRARGRPLNSGYASADRPVVDEIVESVSTGNFPSVRKAATWQVRCSGKPIEGASEEAKISRLARAAKTRLNQNGF